MSQCEKFIEELKNVNSSILKMFETFLFFSYPNVKKENKKHLYLLTADIHIDLIRPLPPSNNFQYCLTMIVFLAGMRYYRFKTYRYVELSWIAGYRDTASVARPYHNFDFCTMYHSSCTIQNTKTWRSRNCVTIIIKKVLLKHNIIIFINKKLLTFYLWKILNFQVFDDILIWISRRACVL